MDDGTVVGRTLEIIECVASLGPGVALGELAAKTAIPKPTARRIAEDLVRRGVLERYPEGYCLGPTLSRVGRIAAVQQSFAEAHSHLEELYAESGGVAWLAAGDGLRRLQPLDMVTRPELRELVADSWPMSMRPEILVNTAIGRLVLADHPDLVEQVTARGVPRSTCHSPETRSQLDVILHQVRDVGAAAECEHGMLGWQCVAAKLPSSAGEPAIIGVTIPAHTRDPRRLLRVTLRAAEALAASVAASRRQELARRVRSEPAVTQPRIP